MIHKIPFFKQASKQASFSAKHINSKEVQPVQMKVVQQYRKFALSQINISQPRDMNKKIIILDFHVFIRNLFNLQGKARKCLWK